MRALIYWLLIFALLGWIIFYMVVDHRQAEECEAKGHIYLRLRPSYASFLPPYECIDIKRIK